jgi:hypothetical protein
MKFPGRPRAVWSAMPGYSGLLLLAGVCPSCWPLYSAALGALGLGFFIEARYALPLTLGFMALAFAALAARARRQRHYHPLALAGTAAVLTLAGKFVLGAPLLTYTGLALFGGASLWQARPPRPACCRADEEPSLVLPNK